MATKAFGIELVPPRNRSSAYDPSHSPVDYKYPPRGSHEETKHTNVNETSTDSVTSHLLKLDSAIETPGTFANNETSLSIFARLPQGWRFGATLGAAVSLFTLIANLVVVIVSAVLICQKNDDSSNSTVASIRKGNCEAIEHVGLVIHLAINVVSTLLLGASNYGAWLDIGVPSLRNFRFIRPIKLVFWILLGLSYKSTFFVSLTNNSYDIYYASDVFAAGSQYEQDIFDDTSSSFVTNPSLIQSMAKNLEVSKNGTSFERLNNSDCIEAYAKLILPDRRNLILVVSNPPRDNSEIVDITSGQAFVSCSNSSGVPVTSSNMGLVSCRENSSLYAIDSYTGSLTPGRSPYITVWFSWICSQEEEYYDDDVPSSTCSDGYWQSIRSNALQWTVYGFDVEYCISELVEDQCRLNVATNILAVVIVFNAVKFIVITMAIWKVRDRPLITIGDAAASFIRQPDITTRGMCLLTKADVTERSSNSKGLAYGSLEPRAYRPKEQRRANAASKARWAISIILTSIALATILGLLGFAVQTLKALYDRGGPKALWDFGVGTVSPYTLIQGWDIPQSGDGAVVATVLIANLPQALLSILYVIINSLFTTLSLAREWSAYAHDRRALRVSHPHGRQRSTYFLQVPYRLGVPLMCFSAFLHWIISQSIFVAKIDGMDANGGTSDDYDYDDTSAVTCGYSPLGMVITVLATFILMVFAGALGRRKLKPGMPMAGSCGVAIAAACHAPEGTSETLPVMWGAIPGSEEENDGQIAGHCAFSNEEVDVLVEGRLYA